MGRVYAVTFEGVTVSAQVDFFELTPADDKPVAIHAIFLSQSSDKGDTEEELLRIKVIRGHATGGSGGSAPTPAPLDPNDAAAGCAAETNNTTIASTGTAVDLYSDVFNIRSGLATIFPPELRPQASQANTTIVVRLMAAPTDALTMNGTLFFEEL